MYRRVAQLLKSKVDLGLATSGRGEYATSMEMAGLSISLLKLDPELKKLLAAPALSPFFEQSAIRG